MKKIILSLSLILTALFAALIPAEVNSVSVGTSAQSAVVMEVVSGRVLFSRNANKPLPIASTTKILTALVVIENSNINSIVEIPKQAVGVEGSSIYLVEGEHLTVKELLYGLMLRSGNDAATALALHCGGTIDGFADMMNETAANLGCQNCNFVNPHGLHNDNHYCSAMDLAKISAHAMKNETFREIAATKTIKISNEKQNYPRVLENKNKLLRNMKNATGIKTGFTKKAGRCFVGSSETDGMQLVTVLLNCGPMFEDCQSMLEFYGRAFEIKNILECVELPSIPVEEGKISGIEIELESDFVYPLAKDGSENNLFEIRIKLPDSVCAPVKKGDKIGEAEIFKDNQLIFSVNIVSITDVEQKGFFDFLFGVGECNETE